MLYRIAHLEGREGDKGDATLEVARIFTLAMCPLRKRRLLRLKSLATSAIQPSKPFPAFSTEAKISTATSFAEMGGFTTSSYLLRSGTVSLLSAALSMVTAAFRVTVLSDQETRLSKLSSWATAWG
jgi:hypothetical protein